ncbi:HAD family hydrolase [Paenibacillus sp. HN-1]|uniref:HAD family hydrolase n=1 Tax=Paenibacillus TaxID=44249 RepID=UPI001CA7CB03|nr:MULTISPECIES: HAD family hydrolase [Paenibacillus]MBY9080545.1 HAD family hydrolase [Paenibacillus sp. CGMCC 1.18879]MBY9085510.1 HAD family hydrolase [Paenibacillus sinensis]
MPELYVNGISVPCRAVLFDKDGTLLDMMEMWGAWAQDVLDRLETELALSGSEFAIGKDKVFGTYHDAHGRITGYDPAGPLSMATIEQSYGILAWQLYNAGVPWNEAVIRVMSIAKDAMNSLRERRSAKPLPGLLRFLAECSAASLRLGVVTSDESAATAEHLEWLGITAYFGSVVTRDKVKRGKPAPEMAERACRELGVSPEEAVIIGDSNADMQMGKGAGLRLAVGITGDLESAEHLADADLIVRDYRELSVLP